MGRNRKQPRADHGQGKPDSGSTAPPQPAVVRQTAHPDSVQGIGPKPLLAGPLSHSLGILFIVGWLIPLCIYSQAKKGDPLEKWAPDVLRLHYNASCLFTARVKFWPQYEVQGTFDGEGQADRQWFRIEHEKYSPMVTFGYRPRIDRVIERASHPRIRPAFGAKADMQLDEVCQWLKKKYEADHPDRPPLAGVRLLRVKNYIKHGGPLAEPYGIWQPTWAADAKPGDIQILYPRPAGEDIPHDIRDGEESEGDDINPRYGKEPVIVTP